MQIYLEEKIGNPALFTGRKKEIDTFLTWIEQIKPQISKSTALLSRRKTGKSALLQRLYNLTFAKNDGVVPFYFEIQENNQWLGHFSLAFFFTFVYQYLAFKSRNPKYLHYPRDNFDLAQQVAQQEGFEFLADLIKQTKFTAQNLSRINANPLWDKVRDLPRTVAAYYDERVVQFIDEFQFINQYIFFDEALTNPAKTMAGSYLHTVEYRRAPLLVSGSWVGWLMDDLTKMLPGRFKYHYLDDLPSAEAIEMIYRYSLLDGVPISEETAYLMAGLTEGSPFYISCVFRSTYPHKDLTTEQGLLETLEYEVLDRHGEIRATWLEYIDSAFPRINDRHAKDIVLYLSKHRDRLFSRQALRNELNLEMADHELNQKLKALWRCDIIEETYFKYRGVQDKIFDKVFRSQYGHDIDAFVPEGARNEYKALFEQLKADYKTLSGEHNRYKGAFAEFMIIHHLRFEAAHEPSFYCELCQNLPDDFAFGPYTSVLPYHSFPLQKPEFQIDLLARAEAGQVTLIGEVKHREMPKFSLTEAHAFYQKGQHLIQVEQFTSACLFVFSSAGFTKKALDFLRDHGVAWSDDPRWLEYRISNSVDPKGF